MPANEKVSSSVASRRTAGLNRSGRPKGVPNKTTRAAKEAIAETFDNLGGVKGLTDWAGSNDDNKRVFYSAIWPKIIPLQLGGDPDNPIVTEIVQRVVHPDR